MPRINVNKLLEKAFQEASKLPEDDQDTFASWLLEELRSEQRWSEAFAASQDVLASLADKAREEHRQGRTRELPANRS